MQRLRKIKKRLSMTPLTPVQGDTIAAVDNAKALRIISLEENYKILKENYKTLSSVMNADFYEAYITVRQNMLLTLLPIDLEMADIQGINKYYLVGLKERLNKLMNKEVVQNDKMKLYALIKWWGNIDAGFLEGTYSQAILAKIETFNMLIKEVKIWELLSEDLVKLKNTAYLSPDWLNYDEWFSKLAEYHVRFGEIFGLPKSRDFAELLHSIRRTFAYATIPIHPADKLIGLFRDYTQANKAIDRFTLQLDKKLSLPSSSTIDYEMLDKKKKLANAQAASDKIFRDMQILEKHWRNQSRSPANDYYALAGTREYEETTAQLLIVFRGWLLLQASLNEKKHDDEITNKLKVSMKNKEEKLNQLMTKLQPQKASLSSKTTIEQAARAYSTSFSNPFSLNDNKFKMEKLMSDLPRP